MTCVRCQRYGANHVGSHVERWQDLERIGAVMDRAIVEEWTWFWEDDDHGRWVPPEPPNASVTTLTDKREDRLANTDPLPDPPGHPEGDHVQGDAGSSEGDAP